MPGEIIGEGLAFVLKLLWRLAVEIILELLVIGGGRLLIHLVRPRAEPSQFVCAAVGVSFWIAVGLLVYGFTSTVAA